MEKCTKLTWSFLIKGTVKNIFQQNQWHDTNHPTKSMASHDSSTEKKYEDMFIVAVK